MANIHIHDAFELALAILAVFPCILIIVIYYILRKDLTGKNYFKLQLIISILINIILNFVKDYEFNHGEKTTNIENQCYNCYKYLAVSKSYFEMVNLFFLVTFIILLNFLLVKDLNYINIVIIILSLVNWVVPIYIIFIYITLNDKNFENFNEIDKYDNVFYSITGQCVYFSEIKRQIHLYLIPFIFLFEVILYILSCRLLISQRNEEKISVNNYKTSIRRITINFISHLVFFGVQYADLFFLDCFIKDDKCEFYYEYYNIVNNASFNIISFTCIFERRIMAFLNLKFSCCLPENNPNIRREEEGNEESDEEEEEEDEHVQVIYNENSTLIDQ